MKTNFYELIAFKVRNSLVSESRRHKFRYAWWLLEPALHMGVFYFVFGVFLQRGTQDFVPFLLVGLVPWLWFNKTVSNALPSIIQGRGLMMQVDVHKIYFPLVSITKDFAKQLVVYPVLLLGIFIYGIEPSYNWFYLPLLIIIQILFNSALALLLSGVAPFFPDLQFLVATALQIMMFGSGIFYSPEFIDPKFHSIFYLNPMASLIQNYREILLYSNEPNWIALLAIGFVALGLIIVAIALIHKHNKLYPRIVIE